MRGLALLAALALPPPAVAAAPAVHHDLGVALDPAARRLVGEDRIRVEHRGEAALSLGAGFRFSRVEVDGEAQALGPDPTRLRLALRGSHEILVRWQGELAAIDTGQDHRATLGAPVAAAGPEGAFLPAGSGWYPRLGASAFSYRLALELPAGLRGIVPGTLAGESESGGRWRARFAFDHPIEGIDLMAGPYRMESRRIATPGGHAVTLRTWFHPQVADLSAPYLDALKDYFDLYERWIGAYPYAEFSVVSSPTPTGFGMPGLTYLGIEVLRLPFIRATSLGHEVLHNWWGNGVWVDFAGGNWSEGLTTFMADYAYKEREGPDAAREMRLGWLRDIAAVPAAADLPLARFTSRTHGASQIVGYHKAAMLFLMLRDAIGAEAFDAGVRRFWQAQRFRVAGWGELRQAFQQAAGRELGEHFAPWLERGGVPALTLEGARAERAGEGWRVRVSLAQDAPPRPLRVPLRLLGARGAETRVVPFSAARGEVVLDSAAPVQAVLLDPDFRVLRRLAPGEAPPILRQVMLDPAAVTVLADGQGPLREPALALAARLLDHAPRSTAPEAVPASPLLLVGSHEAVDRYLARHRLPPRPAALAGRGSAQVWAARHGAGHPMLVVSVRDVEALAALARPLPHYGRQSWLVFDGARATDKGVWSGSPQRAEVAGRGDPP